MYNQTKGDKMTRRSSFRVRKTFYDITNSLPSPNDGSAQECIDRLVKEKMALVTLIQDKNKLLELSRNEIQNLKNSLQKMQLQNWTLAQSNSQMIAELNLSKDKVKLLKHEVMCKEALLKTNNLYLKKEVDVHKPEIQIVDESEINEDTKPSNASRRVPPSSSRSLSSSSISNQHRAEKEAVTNKRRCVRRQSSGLKIEREEQQVDNLFVLDDAKFPDPSVTSKSASNTGGEGRRLSSVGRPSRKAAEKVQSYKERPINIKMRRSG